MVTLIIMVTWGIPGQDGGIFVKTSLPNQTGIRHHAHAKIVDRRQPDVTVAIGKDSRSNLGEHATVKLSIYFLISCVTNENDCWT
jgi:hypothetical protein